MTSDIIISIQQKSHVIDTKLDVSYAEDPALVSRLDELNGEVVGVTSSAKVASAIDSKEAIADAVNAKGGNITADTPLDEYATEIQALTVSVVGKPSDGPRVRFFDYDGTLLKTEYVPKGGAATAPEIPQHERLLFQEWNNDFDNITRDKDVGAIYTTKSGASEFDLVFGIKDSLTLTFTCILNSGELAIDWGDGVRDTSSTLGSNAFLHTYPDYGEYTMKVWGDWSGNNSIVDGKVFSQQVQRRAFFSGFAEKTVNRTDFSERLEVFSVPVGPTLVSMYNGTAERNTVKCFVSPSTNKRVGSWGNTAGFFIMNDGMTEFSSTNTPVGNYDFVYVPDSWGSTFNAMFNVDELYVPHGVTTLYIGGSGIRCYPKEIEIASENITQIRGPVYYNTYQDSACPYKSRSV